VNVSWKVAVASSRLSSPVSSGIADTNRSVRFSWLKGLGGGAGHGFALACLRSSRAVRVAPPVMRMGVRCWFSIDRSFLGEANAPGLTGAFVRGIGGECCQPGIRPAPDKVLGLCHRLITRNEGWLQCCNLLVQGMFALRLTDALIIIDPTMG